MRLLMTCVSVSLLCVLFSSFAKADPPSPCEMIYPKLFVIGNDGSVQVPKDSRNWCATFAKTPTKITFTKVKGTGQTVSIELDSHGKAKSVTELGTGAASFGTVSAKESQMDLGYRNNHCFVEKVTVDGELVAHSEMCHKLRSVFSNPECNKQCEHWAKTAIEKFGGSTRRARTVQSYLNVVSLSEVQSQAAYYLDKCYSYRPIAESVLNEDLWRTQTSSDQHSGDGSAID
jgi:hypothetical protein